MQVTTSEIKWAISVVARCLVPPRRGIIGGNARMAKPLVLWQSHHHLIMRLPPPRDYLKFQIRPDIFFRFYGFIFTHHSEWTKNVAFFQFLESRLLFQAYTMVLMKSVSFGFLALHCLPASPRALDFRVERFSGIFYRALL